MAQGHLDWYRETLPQYITKDELTQLMRKSNWLAAWDIIQTWGWIVAAVALVYYFPNVLTVIIALFIIGGKQLGCAIIMHDCGHDSLFTSRAANIWIGNLFGAYPIMHDLRKYRPYHLEHHIHTGLDDDPDVPLTLGYPTTRASMVRKFMRDLLFINGIKGIVALILMHLGYYRYELNGQVHKTNPSQRTFANYVRHFFTDLLPPVLTNVALWAICWAIGAPYLYLLWIGAMLTTYNFCLRVRSMAEHSMVADRANPQQNTRTIYANFMERLLFAPLHVNYHAEHHLSMGIPSYNFPKMHQLLRERGYFDKGAFANNYWEILRKAIIAN